MLKFILLFLPFLLVASCKIQSNSNSNGQLENSNTLFSLKATSCMGECSEYQIVLKEDSTLYFEGLKHTIIKGEWNKKLSSKEFDEIRTIIIEVEWMKLKKEYVSQMSDLPSYTFVYNEKGAGIRVFQYGADPKSLTKLRKSLLPLIDNKDFF